MEDATETPIALTDAAAAKILEIRAAETIPPEKALRLRVHGGGCAGFNYDLYFDDAKPDMDRRFTLKGVDILVDEMSLMYLTGVEIDYVENPLGQSGFTFKNPNAKSTCGCGSSFSV